MKEWYAAHNVMYSQFKSGIQETYQIWENIILIQAESPSEAVSAAQRRAQQDEGDSGGTFTTDGRPSTWVFAGVRKVVLCVDPSTAPVHGTEITFLEFELPTKEAVGQFVAGEDVTVLFHD